MPLPLVIDVRVRTPAGEIRKRKRVQDDGETVIMEKGKEKHKGWQFKIGKDGLYPVRKPFGGIKLACDVNYGAVEAIQYKEDGTVQAPVYDLPTERRRTSAHILDDWGAGDKPLINPLLFYIMIVGLVVIAGLVFFGFHSLGVF